MTDQADRAAIAEAYGWLWHITTLDKRVKFARHCLFERLSSEERSAGIKAAHNLGARANYAPDVTDL